MMMHNPYPVHELTQDSVAAELRQAGIAADQTALLTAKGETRLIHVENMSRQAAELLQQTIRDCGGDGIIQESWTDMDGEKWSALLTATRQQWDDLLDKLHSRPHGLDRLGMEIAELFHRRQQLRERRQLVCGPHTLPLGQRTLVMGILNVTPDSFSDGGRFAALDRALAHAHELVAAGADIIDIGGESTRPGAEPVELAEELARVLPIIEALARECPVPLSIDTYKAEVARQAVASGAHIINDVWGAKRDPMMAAVAARLDVPLILMHNRTDMNYTHFFSDMVRDLRGSVQVAREAGVRDDQIILDPGIGFAKTLEHNLETMRRLDDLVSLGYPVLLGTSRKSMIGRVLDLPVEERLEGTAATVALGAAKGCHIVRVHDVKQMKRVVTMMDAMLKGGHPVGQAVL
ncbi:dihydropteroate synthase [Brevibacillus humidisoli]|uniref:dihydropteroate synthase n=1 Tax=Brevibacillus humidisoli TaxID=2895522 RepID=UPI001E58D762|nr:dihydropteroate synthase [Brevibacillus humidisoli]UFJ40611.1 dihydropteroate synthase [Brevibacillus humidisoli]